MCEIDRLFVFIYYTIIIYILYTCTPILIGGSQVANIDVLVSSLMLKFIGIVLTSAPDEKPVNSIVFLLTIADKPVAPATSSDFIASCAEGESIRMQYNTLAIYILP